MGVGWVGVCVQVCARMCAYVVFMDTQYVHKCVYNVFIIAISGCSKG